MTRREWLLIALAVVAVIYALLKPADLKKIQTTHETVVTKDRYHTDTKLKYVGMPGSTVVIEPNGEVIVYGPATLDLTTSATGESSTSRTTDTRTEKKRVRAWSVGTGVGVLLPRATWNAQVQANVGHVLFLDVGAFAQIEGAVTSYVPTRYGAGVLLTF